MQDTKVVISALTACDTRNLLEDTFKRFEIESEQKRIECLNICMGQPKTFFSCGNSNINEADLYEMTVQMFLSGAWKLAELYK